MSKSYKLTIHQKSQQKAYAAEDIAFNPKDFPFLAVGDVAELYYLEEDSVHVVVKVTPGSLREDFTVKDTISVEQSIATMFSLKPFTDVIVDKVAPVNVQLDSVELTFKDQYLGRSEMWRLKNSLVNSSVYLSKKLEFCSSTIRCQVHEMWSHGEKVASGVVADSTKFVFRSSTSMVYVFIQMSSEMWEFDIYGDLYFEKAVNGFLSELFGKWKKTFSNHEVTIVLFSRLYYNASSLDQFPDCIHDCLQTDYKGRFYEDFYRVAVQNEKFEDWSGTLMHLRHLFVDYQKYLLHFHSKRNTGIKVPKAYISSAAQGNFLEVLNMSLNVFEKHYIDRSFDRTGQLSVVITPGVGVFEVDRELTNVTMQRVIDNGVGSDLVCVGEQPLHAVPLLKFHNKTAIQNGTEDYSMPHWINLSFYSTNKKVGYSTYIPRIKLPTTCYRPCNWGETFHDHCRLPATKGSTNDNSWPNSVFDYEDYDHKVFNTNGTQGAHRRSLQYKKPSQHRAASDFKQAFRRQNSEPDIHRPPSMNNDHSSLSNVPYVTTDPITFSKSPVTHALSPMSSPAITIPVKKPVSPDHLYSSSFGALNIETGTHTPSRKEKIYFDDILDNRPLTPVSSSHGSSPKDRMLIHSMQSKEFGRSTCKALINPFDPSHAVIKLTSNRRRWTHIFPRGPSGHLIQQHHFQMSQSKLEVVLERGGDTPEAAPNVNASPASSAKIRAARESTGSRQSSDGNVGKGMLTLLWGPTGEQEWTPAMTTGVDWKSLTIPACLPITTDYFPDGRSLQLDYLESEYSLLPDDVNIDYAQQRAIYRRPLTTSEVFMELVCQRLAQGFQLIVKNVEEKPAKILTPTTKRTINHTEGSDEYLLSIGRIFHRITLTGSKITVTRYRPKHPYPLIKIYYKYRFHAPHNENYEVSWADFTTEKLENYKWNYLDHYVCTRGDMDYALTEHSKYWRFRMFLLPAFQGQSKSILEGAEHCDIYSPMTEEEHVTLIEGFLRFIETCINRIRRPNNSSTKGARGTSGGSQNAVTTGFRERVNSNRLGERPRARSGSKATEKWTTVKHESGSGRVSPASGPFELKTGDSQQSLTEVPLEGSSSIFSASDTTDTADKASKIPLHAPHEVIVEAMCAPNTGLSFIKSGDLPCWTFVSGDACSWLMHHLEGIHSDFDAISKFSTMLSEKLICHASGDMNHPFINGFYLYYIVSAAPSEESLTQWKPHGDLATFRNEWMEVKVDFDRQLRTIKDNQNAGVPGRYIYNFFDDNIQEELYSELEREYTASYKDVYIDIDVGKKSDRQEWGHVRHQTKYKPQEAFEITLQWVQATGTVTTELVQGWARKAQQCNLQLVPIPTDPFALPRTSQSDPLRGPIFIPLCVQSLEQDTARMFEEFSKDSWDIRLFLFQKAILARFGFMPSPKAKEVISATKRNLNVTSVQHHFVHSSGNMFILIPSTLSAQLSQVQSPPARESPVSSSNVANTSHEGYITRHVNGQRGGDFVPDTRVGFLWSWNYMVSKRWKTSSTPALGDDPFMYKVLKDFQEFCLNVDGRLVKFWVTATSAYYTNDDIAIGKDLP